MILKTFLFLILSCFAFAESYPGVLTYINPVENTTTTTGKIYFKKDKLNCSSDVLIFLKESSLTGEINQINCNNVLYHVTGHIDLIKHSQSLPLTTNATHFLKLDQNQPVTIIIESGF